jgi:hypothetical protein
MIICGYGLTAEAFLLKLHNMGRKCLQNVDLSVEYALPKPARVAELADALA